MANLEKTLETTERLQAMIKATNALMELYGCNRRLLLTHTLDDYHVHFTDLTGRAIGTLFDWAPAEMTYRQIVAFRKGIFATGT